MGLRIHSLHQVEAEVEGVHGAEDDPEMAAEVDDDREAAVDHATQGCQDLLPVAMGHSCLERRN